MKIEKNKIIITTFVYHLKRNNMKQEFIPPQEQALALKELGFDEPCFMSYRGKFDLYRNGMGGYLSEMTMERNSDLDKYEINKTEQYWISAPTFSQCFRWVREKHDLDSFVKHLYKSTIKVGYYFGIDEYKGVKFQMDFDVWYNTYEEAELECLKKLIEIVKKK
jgi:hypothetical protein